MSTVVVIICTYNRCESLAKTLGSIAESEVTGVMNWEVLVVDNNSTDETRAIVDTMRDRAPGRFKYLFEPRPGKSYALNSGIRAANCTILAFLDDDVTVEPGWLEALTLPLLNGQWSGSGGRTLPTKVFSPPRWLPQDMGGILFAHFDLGDEPGQLNLPPYGTNMAIRREMFERYGGFRTDLGPSPNREIPRPNEDTEFGRRLMAAGEHLCYVPSAIVYHPVPEERVNKDYFLKFWYDYGRAAVRELTPGPGIWGIGWRYLTLVKHVIVMGPQTIMRWLFTMEPRKRFHAKCLVWRNTGEIVEIHRRWFGANELEFDPIPTIDKGYSS